MPANKSAVTRYRVIDSCLNNRQKPFPSIEFIAEKCSQMLGSEVSVSTIEKDFRAMKEGVANFPSAPIVYNKKEKGYAYGELGFSINELQLQQEEWDSLRYAALLLFQYKEVPLFKNFKDTIERINTRFNICLDHDDPFLTKHIQFETSVSFAGYHWIESIFSAIQQKHAIKISYENIYKQELKAYEVVPYLLKEHRNNWYAIGWVSERNNFLTFALNRIQTLEVIPIKQSLRNDFNHEAFMQHAVGIMEHDVKPVKVILSIHAPYNKLVQMEPIHASQKTISQQKNSIKISLNVFLTPELYNHILGMGPYCKVQQPRALRTTIQSMLEKTLKQYQPSK